MAYVQLSFVYAEALMSNLVPTMLKVASLPIVLNLKTAVVMIAVKFMHPSMQVQQSPINRALKTQTPTNKTIESAAKRRRVMPEKVYTMVQRHP